MAFFCTGYRQQLLRDTSQLRLFVKRCLIIL